MRGSQGASRLPLKKIVFFFKINIGKLPANSSRTLPLPTPPNIDVDFSWRGISLYQISTKTENNAVKNVIRLRNSCNQH